MDHIRINNHYKGGVCLGADTRATEGPIVADKNCEKIHYIAPNIYCCGAGTSADTENTTGLITSTHSVIIVNINYIISSQHLFQASLHFTDSPLVVHLALPLHLPCSSKCFSSMSLIN